MRSFQEFFDTNYDGVRRSLAVAIGDPVAAEELAQDAFTRALASWRRVSRMDRPAGWVYVVALRGARRQWGRQVESPVREGRDAADDVVMRVALEDAILGLPERQRVALVLRFLVDLPLAEVAAAMGCAVGTVKSTLHAALARLGEEIDREDWDVVG